MRHDLIPLLVALVIAAPSVAGPSPSPASPAAADEDIAAYRKSVEKLKSRNKLERTRPTKFRFDHLRKVVWPKIVIESVKNRAGAKTVTLQGDSSEYRTGDKYRGAQVLRITDDVVAFQIRDQRREFNVPKGFPAFSVRTTRKIDGEWTATLDDDPQPRKPDDKYKEARIVVIGDGWLVAEWQGQRRTLKAEQGAKPFPQLRITGVLRMGDSLQVFFAGLPNAKVVGDELYGGKITEIQRDFVKVDYLEEEIIIRAR